MEYRFTFSYNNKKKPIKKMTKNSMLRADFHEYNTNEMIIIG